MGIVKFSAIVSVILVFLVSGLVAGGFEISGVGTKARGMGGAYRAIADDWTAAYYNPAGYATIPDNQLGGNMAFLHYRDEIVPNFKWGGTYETGIFNDRVNYNAHEILSNPSAGFIVRLPVWGETVFGLSAYQPFDQNITWEMFDLLPAYNDSASVPGDQYRNNLDVVAFQLTAAREFSEDKLSLGIGLQILRGDLLFSNLYFRQNPLSASGDPTYDFFADRPYDRIPEWSKNDGNGWGFGLRGGMKWNASEKLDVGVTIGLPFSITISGTTENRFYMPKNNTLWQHHDSAQVRNIGSLGHLFLAGSVVVDEADFETDLDLPASFGFGLAYHPNEKLTVSFDAEYTLWSTFKGFEFIYTNHRGLTGPADTSAMAREFFTSNLSVPVDWKDAGKVMLGISYDYASYLTLLGGLSVDQSPAREVKQFIPQFIDTGDKWGFNFGFITHIERWELGLVTSIQTQPDLGIGGLEEYDTDATMQRFPGNYKANTYETILSFNYRF